MLAHAWHEDWSSAPVDLLTNTGQDLISITSSFADDSSELALASTCKRLRAIVLQRLLARKEKALKVYLYLGTRA